MWRRRSTGGCTCTVRDPRGVDGPVVSFPAFTGQSMVGQSTGTGFRWNGAIDDVSVYGYALSDAEILSHAREQDATDAVCDLAREIPTRAAGRRPAWMGTGMATV